MREWFRNVWVAVSTVLRGLWVTLRVFRSTYRRKAFTEIYEYPETPVPVKARYRGFHRFDLTTCIGCEKCAVACPVDCIYIEKEKSPVGKGISDRQLHHRLHQVHVLCTVCRAVSGGLHLHGVQSRPQLLQSRRMHCRLRQAAARDRLGSGHSQSDGRGRIESVV